MTPHHMGGNNFAVLLDPHYWERFWIWNFRNGTSIILMLTAFYQVWKLRTSWNQESWYIRTVTIWALGVIPYWIIVRGTQATAPWYSFPFILAWSLLGVMGLFKLKPRWRYGAVCMLAVLSLTQVGWTLNFRENLNFNIKTTPIGLSCPELWLNNYIPGSTTSPK